MPQGIARICNAVIGSKSRFHVSSLWVGVPDSHHALAPIRDGAVLRVRPKATTVAVRLAGLVPIVRDSGSIGDVLGWLAQGMTSDQMLNGVPRAHR